MAREWSRHTIHTVSDRPHLKPYYYLHSILFNFARHKFLSFFAHFIILKDISKKPVSFPAVASRYVTRANSVYLCMSPVLRLFFLSPSLSLLLILSLPLPPSITLQNGHGTLQMNNLQVLYEWKCFNHRPKEIMNLIMHLYTTTGVFYIDVNANDRRLQIII